MIWVIHSLEPTVVALVVEDLRRPSIGIRHATPDRFVVNKTCGAGVDSKSYEFIAREFGPGFTIACERKSASVGLDPVRETNCDVCLSYMTAIEAVADVCQRYRYTISTRRNDDMRIVGRLKAGKRIASDQAPGRKIEVTAINNPCEPLSVVRLDNVLVALR